MLQHAVTKQEVVIGIQESSIVYKHFQQTPQSRRQTLKRRAAKVDPLVISISMDAANSAKDLAAALGDANVHKVAAIGEMVPERYDIVLDSTTVAIVLQSMSCHAYVEVPFTEKSMLRVGSMDTLLTFYFAFYYGDIDVGVPILCICQKYVDWLETLRDPKRTSVIPAFPVECMGYQAGLPELKRLQRMRAKEEKERLKVVKTFRESIRSGKKIRTPNTSRAQ
jgi:hypothetical protein